MSKKDTFDGTTNIQTNKEDGYIYNEKYTMAIIRTLQISEKRLLWEIIRKANKDGITIYKGTSPSLQVLINKELITINKLYQGKGYSLIVLPKCQTLIRKLTRI